MRGLVLILVGMLYFSAWGDASYYSAHDRGWHWYRDPVEQTPTLSSKSKALLSSDPISQMKAVRHTVEQALDRAILFPTPQNVRAYILIQNAVSHNASRFAEVWKEVLWQAPLLDYTVTHPTTQIARDVYLTQQEEVENNAIDHLAQHSGLFFFYRSSCPYCQRFAPIVRDFATHYHFTVVPITTDGISLPAFPNSQVDNGQSQLFQVTVEPALFTVDPYTHHAIPVSYGLVSEAELKNRLQDIASREEQHA